MQNNIRPQPDPRYTCNAEEADTRIWVHVRKTKCTQVLILSPDTDVYNIGLPLVPRSGKEVVVQISPLNSKDTKYVHLCALHSALHHDPDLASLNSTQVAQIL